MDIIISANEKILLITQNKSFNLLDSMTEEEYRCWLDNLVKIEKGYEVDVQEI